ncbi:hypothetical protein JOY44_00070 [Phormidium sp. CLA17]|nr:hypothetical protein [Leptolyngbya sp. Cla-17]MBM0740051.1 hypothetical protein [Leptolyngbya sp. Cla-17]
MPFLKYAGAIALLLHNVGRPLYYWGSIERSLRSFADLSAVIAQLIKGA